MSCYEFSRRGLLGGSTALFAWAFMPHVASAAGARDPRFLTIVLRGGLDGLAAVPPVGDPDYQRLRRSTLLSPNGDHAALKLDGTFALNPSMPNLYRLYQKKEAAIVHAVATPYRERSHFDGQDVLETGLDHTGGHDGWLNRAVAIVPKGERTRKPVGLAIGATTPLILQGSAEITSWAPQSFQTTSDDTVRRLLEVYDARDPVLARALRGGAEVDKFAMDQGLNRLGRNGDPVKLFSDQAAAAARFMSMPDGPRLAAMSFDGWDTHADEGPSTGRLARLLGALDGAIATLETSLGPVWKDTVVAIVTEFGRTAHENGTDGTDHGTATVAFLLGGAVRGGRVVADWPGLADAKLYEKRDVAPTTDLRAVLKSVLAEHVGLDRKVLTETVFPGSGRVAQIDGLVSGA